MYNFLTLTFLLSVSSSRFWIILILDFGRRFLIVCARVFFLIFTCFFYHFRLVCCYFFLLWHAFVWSDAKQFQCLCVRACVRACAEEFAAIEFESIAICSSPFLFTSSCCSSKTSISWSRCPQPQKVDPLKRHTNRSEKRCATLPNNRSTW